MNRVHPLINLADTIPLTGDPLTKLRETFEREAKYLRTMGGEGHIELVSAMMLAEYVLLKRQQAKSIFPIPKATRAPITVRARPLKTK